MVDHFEDSGADASADKYAGVARPEAAFVVLGDVVARNGEVVFGAGVVAVRVFAAKDHFGDQPVGYDVCFVQFLSQLAGVEHFEVFDFAVGKPRSEYDVGHEWQQLVQVLGEAEQRNDGEVQACGALERATVKVEGFGDLCGAAVAGPFAKQRGGGPGAGRPALERSPCLEYDVDATHRMAAQIDQVIGNLIVQMTRFDQW